MLQPLISIIITVLNGAETMEKTLSSIAVQSFTDYELVVVDGGSKDGTVEILKQAQMKNIVISVIDGIGLYAGLNEGVRLSTGQWLYFMGADDQLNHLNTLREVAEFIEKYKRSDSKVIVGNVDCIKQQYTLKPMLGSPWLMRHHVHHQGMFYDRMLFDEAVYNENLRISSDYEFNLKLAIDHVPHQTMPLTICKFGGDGVSENQLKRGYTEMQNVHSRLFTGGSRYWIMSYFWFRRGVGAMLRRYNLKEVRLSLKKVFG